MNVLDGLTGVIGHKPLTVSEQVADALREAIADGSLQAGTPLRQDDLAVRFGLSRMPVRDALRKLEVEGIVAIHPTRGAFVARMDGAEIREIYAVRELLELEALRLALPRLTDNDCAEAAAVLDLLDAESDAGRWGTLNRAFHMALYRPCGNARLLTLIEAQHAASDRYVRILLSRVDYRARSQSEHRALLAACRKRAEQDSRTCLRGHLQDGSNALVESVR